MEVTDKVMESMELAFVFTCQNHLSHTNPRSYPKRIKTKLEMRAQEETSFEWCLVCSKMHPNRSCVV